MLLLICLWFILQLSLFVYKWAITGTLSGPDILVDVQTTYMCLHVCVMDWRFSKS